MRTLKGLLILIATVFAVGLLSGCHPHGFHEGGFAKHALSHLDDWAKDLDLNDAQKERYQELRSKMETALTKQQEERKLVFSKLREEINSDKPDPNQIATVLKGRVHALSAFVEQNMDLMLEFYNVLDANQQARVLATVQKRFDKIDRFINES